GLDVARVGGERRLGEPACLVELLPAQRDGGEIRQDRGIARRKCQRLAQPQFGIRIVRRVEKAQRLEKELLGLLDVVHSRSQSAVAPRRRSASIISRVLPPKRTR